MTAPDPHPPSATSPKFQRTEFRGGGRTPQEQELVKRAIEFTDRQIDALDGDYFLPEHQLCNPGSFL